MVIAQEGRCAICETPAELVVDHCHESSRVRALLCGTCNIGLGQFKDEPARMRAAADYIETYQALASAESRTA
jgi:Recombination endonuclease VII